jgi:dUTPase
MERDQLVLGGNRAFANGCAYDFKAARVVYGGVPPGEHEVRAVDLTEHESRSAVVEPSEVIWVRSRERVSIPPNMVGIWTQTNSLSRKGLLLLNSTLVEPGYTGHLSAHFVNLGSSAAVLNANTTIAKLMFLEINTDATSLVDSKPFIHYDQIVNELAAKSNASFLRISELAPELRTASDESVSDAKAKITNALDESVRMAKERFLDMENKTFVRVGSGFAVGLILATGFAVWIYPILRSADNESKARIEETVKEQNALMSLKLERLQHDLDSIRRNTNPALSEELPKPSPK